MNGILPGGGGAPRAESPPEWVRKYAIVFSSAIPVVGVFAFSWDAVRVLFLYWLDGWLCMVEVATLGAVRVGPEVRALVVGYGPLRRWAFWAAVLTLLWLVVTLLALIPAFWIVPHLQDDRDAPFGFLLTDRSIWVCAFLAALPRGFRVVRAALGSAPPPAPRLLRTRFEFFLHRMLVVFILAGGLADIGLGAVKVLVLFVAFAFAYTELYPERYARLLGRGGRPQ